MSRRRKRPLLQGGQRLADGCFRSMRAVARRCRRVLIRLLRLVRPGGPTVIIDARRRQARRLHSSLGRAARGYANALGVELPANLVVVAQRVVHEGGQLNGLFQAFQSEDGTQRYVLLLALSVNGRQVSEDELLAALRAGLTRALEGAIGRPVRSLPIDLEVPRARAGAPIAEFRPDVHMPSAEPERGAIPIQRIENKQAS